MIASISDLQSHVHSTPGLLGGVPVFRGTRVPVSALFDYLRAGDGIDRFMDHFPGVAREQVDAVLQYAENDLLSVVKSA